MNGSNKRNVLFGIIGVVALILIFNSLYLVKEGQFKVVLKFGEAVRVAHSPGLQFKIPFIENTMTLPKQQMSYDSNPTHILTKDKKIIFVVNYTIWRIDEPEKFLRTLRTVGVGSPRWMMASASSKKARMSRMKVETRKPRNTGPTVSVMT